MLFVVVERRAAEPIVPLDVFRVRPVTVANGLSALVGGALPATMFFLALYLQRVLGMDPLRPGSRSPRGRSGSRSARAGRRAGSPSSGRAAASSWAPCSRPARCSGCRGIDVEGRYAVDVLVPFTLAFAGFGAAGLPLTVTATSGLGPERAGLASGLLSTARQVGSAVNLAVLVAVATAWAAGHGGAGTAAGLTAGFGVGFLVGRSGPRRRQRRGAGPARCGGRCISPGDARHQTKALVLVTGATAEWSPLVIEQQTFSPLQGFSPQAVDTDRRWGPLRGLPVTWMRAAGRAERRGPTVVWTKWSYMDHWVTETPQGPQPPSFNRAYMDRYIKQLSALGFTGFDTFFFYLPFYAGMYGGVPGFERFLQDNGFDKITGIFSAYPSATKYTAPHVRETHDRIVADCTNTLRMCEGLTGVENFIVMPTSTYYQTEPVTDDTIKVVADLWNRVGKLTLEQGMKTTCHFEFWGAIRTREQLDTFFRYTDPEYVHFFCDTAQHTIAGVDPIQLFRDYKDRCTGFHFKDTKNVDEHEAYRTPPDPELMAPQVTRWFYEMGEGGLVDFPALMKEIVALAATTAG